MHTARGGRGLALSAGVALLMILTGAAPGMASSGLGTYKAMSPAAMAHGQAIGASIGPRSSLAGGQREFSHPEGTPHPSIVLCHWFNPSAGLTAVNWVDSEMGQPADGSPPAVAGASMAEYPIPNGSGSYFDVLFGGYNSSTGVMSNQTWVYYGQAPNRSPSYWINVTAYTGAPPALGFASMTFDPRIPAMVLFGGLTTDGNLSNQTW